MGNGGAEPGVTISARSPSDKIQRAGVTGTLPCAVPKHRNARGGGTGTAARGGGRGGIDCAGSMLVFPGINGKCPGRGRAGAAANKGTGQGHNPRPQVLVAIPVRGHSRLSPPAPILAPPGVCVLPYHGDRSPWNGGVVSPRLRRVVGTGMRGDGDGENSVGTGVSRI